MTYDSALEEKKNYILDQWTTISQIPVIAPEPDSNGFHWYDSDWASQERVSKQTVLFSYIEEDSDLKVYAFSDSDFAATWLNLINNRASKDLL